MDPRLYEAATEANFDNIRFVEEICYYCLDLIEKKNSNGDTPLHIAARAGYPSVVEFLIFSARYFIVSFSQEAGDDDENVLLRVPNTDGSTHLHEADDNGENNENVLLRVPNKDGNTALHEAVRSRNPKVVGLLMCADPQLMSIVNKNGESPLYLAADRGLLLTVHQMLDLIRHDTSQSIYGGPNGQTPMHAAVIRERTDILQILLQEKNELIKVADYDGRTPLHFAASFGYFNGVVLLLIADALSAYQEDKDGLSPIHMAAIKGHNDIVEHMLIHWPNFRELLNRENQNVLHLASKSGKQKVVNSMLKIPKFWMLLNETDYKGNTPLHLATIHRHPKIVSTLVRSKIVDTSVMNDDGLTARDIAEKYFNTITTIASFRELLTLVALRIANAPESQHRPVIEENKQPNMTDYTLGFYKDRINSLALLATLITTVTFAAGFTMPGGYNNDGPNKGMATMLTKKEFQIFLVCNTIAMYSSFFAAVTLIWAQLLNIHLLVVALKISLVMMTIALTAMELAFAAGVYLVVSKLKWLAYLVLVICVIFQLCLLALLMIFQVLHWSKYPILRHICSSVFHFVVLTIGHSLLDGFND